MSDNLLTIPQVMERLGVSKSVVTFIEGDSTDECALHARFHHLRLEGSEWFNYGDELREYLEGLSCD